jgi:hypothetical protein
MVTLATGFLGYEAIRRVCVLQRLFGLARDAGFIGNGEAARRRMSVAQRVVPHNNAPEDMN